MARRMSYRESAAARRQIRTLTSELENLRHGRGTVIARGSICDIATSAIKTARALGYTVVVEEYDGKITAYAVKRGDRA